MNLGSTKANEKTELEKGKKRIMTPCFSLRKMQKHTNTSQR